MFDVRSSSLIFYLFLSIIYYEYRITEDILENSFVMDVIHGTVLMFG